MNEAKARSAKIKAFGLVRDKDGRPLVDDPKSLPREIIDQLSDEDLIYLGLKEG